MKIGICYDASNAAETDDYVIVVTLWRLFYFCGTVHQQFSYILYHELRFEMSQMLRLPDISGIGSETIPI